ncbi:alkaline phosphatase family protein [Leptospira sp. 2 VSF19]|uniref:Alkaline phosphatase family protein n=1 Tax=Leptospira soteropolitanensis TaxID=2950025 RepID=A0AAW5VGL8_9LEPT|nr:alkaline phosphatase D family protein [Leptospira soteropolitanensis]MCW7494435.1 alkaline phosphatase family protein [Leptospira soteropolitanensis]MCW7502029.1 alkaline phosphatase family protein [Leptospira soteropolitanensis]MCW7524281.1 alkaline phosphatase family protein [Leptospira soteropolitanensis]MCW7528146.1 alkaline phosphatase family protein [Leptospira soteropolitanensis]MCW7531999.1 alkaline phosphatase family protein [Leptospira soteropolitanensis]
MKEPFRFVLFYYLIFYLLIFQLPIFGKESESLRIGFGSCLHQDKESPILNQWEKESFDLILLLGDNIYADSLVAEEKIPAYQKQFVRPQWKKIRATSQILATWDDHDYGINDSGSEYVDKEKSREVFISQVGALMPKGRRLGTKDGKGIFHSYFLDFKKKKIHIVIPDTRFFRSELKPSFWSFFTGKKHYRPNENLDATLLGEEQWKWLTEELEKPSDFLVFVSGIQVIPTEQPFEKWGNFPKEREKLFQLLGSAKTSDLVILSGDRHIAEIYEYPIEDKRKFIEITSSSLNFPLPFLTLEYDSRFKLTPAFLEENYGVLRIQIKEGKLVWRAEIKDKIGNVVREYGNNDSN